MLDMKIYMIINNFLKFRGLILIEWNLRILNINIINNKGI